jgi:hypothetical protein
MRRVIPLWLKKKVLESFEPKDVDNMREKYDYDIAVKALERVERFALMRQWKKASEGDEGIKPIKVRVSR